MSLRRWRIAFGLLVVATAVLAWMPGRSMPMQGNADKLNHLAAFAVLGAAAWRAFPGQRARAFCALLAFGVLIELVQIPLPTRSAEWGDLAADALGLLLGAGVSVAVTRARRGLRSGHPRAVPRDADAGAARRPGA